LTKKPNSTTNKEKDKVNKDATCSLTTNIYQESFKFTLGFIYDIVLAYN